MIEIINTTLSTPVYNNFSMTILFWLLNMPQHLPHKQRHRKCYNSANMARNEENKFYFKEISRSQEVRSLCNFLDTYLHMT